LNDCDEDDDVVDVDESEQATTVVSSAQTVKAIFFMARR
jgi:hypothetical protein